MDARDRLRRYLEQRRELGESEFVLDGMAVEDVLSLVGVRRASGDARPSGKRSAPSAPMDRPAVTARADAPAAPAVPTDTPPPAPEMRFSGASSTDWRAALRDAGVGKSSAESGPVRDLPPARDAQDIASVPSLEALATRIAACTRCVLCQSATQAVPGEGSPTADLLCIGEAPGAEEDKAGRPFVGAAGEVLRKGLAALKLSESEYFIANVLKHRPPGNRDPLPDEVAACQPFLLRQIELLQPKVILALGRFAAQTLLGTSAGIGALRGQTHTFRGIPLVVTYHPAATLRNDEWKRPLWDDMKLARRLLDDTRAANGASST